MALSRDVVIRMLGDASSAIAAQKAAAEAADVSVTQYRKAERELSRVQAAERAAHQQRKQNFAEASQAATMLGGAMLLAFGITVKAAADFDKAMSGVGAATMANAEQMKVLRQAALDAGAATMYSARDAADAETELGKAGISVRDILNGGLVGALNLAAAGQLDVGQAAGIAATAMQQFHLQGSQASHVADLLAAGSNKALGSVEDLSNALKYVGPVAAGMGVSIEETTGTLAMFAQAGILGEQAGTSLRGVISALSSPSKIAAAEMEGLGISVFDAHGKFVGLDGVAGQLHDSMSGLTEAERSEALGRIFGNEQLTAARVLYSQGAQGVEEWTGKVNDSGYAARQAAKLTDNLTGDIERLGGSLSTVLIKGGEGSTAVLRFLTQAAEGTVNAFGELPGPLAAVGVGLLGVLGAGTTLLGVLGTVIPRVQAARESLRGLGAAGQMADKGLGTLGRVGGYATAAVVGVSALAAAYDALNPPTEVAIADSEVLTQRLVQLGNESGRIGISFNNVGLGDFVDQLVATKDHSYDTVTALGSLGKAAAMTNVVFADFEEKALHANDAFAQAQQSIKDTDDALSGMISSGHPEAAVAAFDKIMQAARGQGLSIDEIKAKFPGYIAALQGFVGESTYTVDASGNVTNALGEQKSAADALKQSWDNLNGIGTDVVQTQAEWTLALDSLAHGAASSSRSLDINSVAGAHNAEQLVTVASKAKDAAMAIGNQDGYDAGIAASNRFRNALIDQAVKAGYSREKVVALMDSIFKLDKTDSTSDLKAVDGVSPAVARAKGQLAALDGDSATVTINTIENRILNATPLGSGGGPGPLMGFPSLPGRASGGSFWPGTFLVGERGPEIVQFGGSGFVTPADVTQRVMAAAGGPSGAAHPAHGLGPVHVTANVRVMVGDREITDIARVEAEAAVTDYAALSTQRGSYNP